MTLAELQERRHELYAALEYPEWGPEADMLAAIKRNNLRREEIDTLDAQIVAKLTGDPNNVTELDG
jgi:hypothetical protein